MLDRLADLGEQCQTSAGREGMLVAIFGDLETLHQLHHKIRPPIPGCARIEDVSDVRMFHQRQRLSFGLKACNYAFGVHPRFNDLERDAPADRLFLFCDENPPATSFSDLLY